MRSRLNGQVILKNYPAAGYPVHFLAKKSVCVCVFVCVCVTAI